MLKLNETKFYFWFRAALHNLKCVFQILGFFSQPLFYSLFKVRMHFSLLPLEAEAKATWLVCRLPKYSTGF